MAIDYFLLITWGFWGILQISATYSGLFGLRVFPGHWRGYLAGAVITISSFIWFFATGNRNIEGHITGVQGAEQFELIFAGVAVSTVATALLVSILHLREEPGRLTSGYTLEQVRHATYLQILVHYLKRKQ